MDEQQDQRELPTIFVGWDPDSQNVMVRFKGGPEGDFKTWRFVGAVLAMAKEVADQNEKLAQLKQLQAAQQESQQVAALRQSLKV